MNKIIAKEKLSKIVAGAVVLAEKINDPKDLKKEKIEPEKLISKPKVNQ